MRETCPLRLVMGAMPATGSGSLRECLVKSKMFFLRRGRSISQDAKEILRKARARHGLSEVRYSSFHALDEAMFYMQLILGHVQLCICRPLHSRQVLADQRAAWSSQLRRRRCEGRRGPMHHDDHEVHRQRRTCPFVLLRRRRYRSSAVPGGVLLQVRRSSNKKSSVILS